MEGDVVEEAAGGDDAIIAGWVGGDGRGGRKRGGNGVTGDYLPHISLESPKIPNKV